MRLDALESQQMKNIRTDTIYDSQVPNSELQKIKKSIKAVVNSNMQNLKRL